LQAVKLVENNKLRERRIAMVGLCKVVTETIVTIPDGYVTIESPRDGSHRTFRVRTQRAGAKFAPGKQILSILRGPENEHDYEFFAFIVGTEPRVFSRLRGRNGKPSNWEWFARMVTNPRSFEALGYVYRREARCRMCFRLLTTPESIDAGIGPECARR
jgi:hypothetical protein